MVAQQIACLVTTETFLRSW